MKTLAEKLGGIDITAGTETMFITTVGGFDKYLNPQTQNVLVGDVTKTFIKNKITEWQTFKDVYYENGILNPKYYDKLIDVINNIFPMPIHSEEDKELVYMITTMYNSSDDQFINGINTNLNLLYPLKLSLRHLFMIWKVHLEKLIEIFINVREQYIERNKLEKKNKENDFALLIDRWVAIDMENNIDTSSPILFLNFPPKITKLEKSIPSIEWHINGAEKNITNTINNFLKKIKKFEYHGFCIHMVIKRFVLLMTFPFVDLLKVINILDISNKYNVINENMEKILIEIKSLKNNLDLIKDYKNIKITRLQVPSARDFPKNPGGKIKFYEKYIKAYLKIYQQILPMFSKKEKLICELSLKINLISDDITKINNTFDKILSKK